MTKSVAAWVSASTIEIEELHNSLELLSMEMSQASEVVNLIHIGALSAGSAEILDAIHAIGAADDRLAAAVRAARQLPPPPHAASAVRLGLVLDHLEEFVDSDLGDGIALVAWRAAMTELAEFADTIAAAL